MELAIIAVDVVERFALTPFAVCVPTRDDLHLHAEVIVTVHQLPGLRQQHVRLKLPVYLGYHFVVII